MKRLLLMMAAVSLNGAAVAGHDRFAGFGIELSPLGSYRTGVFGEGAAEIVAHDPGTQRLFVVNANDVSIDVLDIRNPALPAKVASIDASALGGSANSVDVAHGVVAVAIEADDKQANGLVAFYDARSLELLNTVPAGALPDMLAFSPDGRYVLVANEGEPNGDYTVDPEGSVTVIDLRRGVKKARARTAGFTRFNREKDQLTAAGVRIYGPGASVAQDLEPEYIAIPEGANKAYVSLQENNAIAEIDIRKAKVTRILPLNFKDHSLAGNELDASDKDNGINIRNWPVVGMYQPDSVASYRFRGETLLVTANEGDARDYDGFSEEARVKDLLLDPAVFPDADELQKNKNLGRLKTTLSTGDIDGDGDYERIYSYGARSFSIFDARGDLIYDSGSEFERILAEQVPDFFNAGNDNNEFDNRSDDKGPEPEGIALGNILGRTFAFVGLERTGGIMVHDITDPRRVSFVQYINNRDFTEPPCLIMDDDECETGEANANPAAGDLGPEGVKFIPWYQSPIRQPLLVVGNEVSGSTTIYKIDLRPM